MSSRDELVAADEEDEEEEEEEEEEEDEEEEEEEGTRVFLSGDLRTISCRIWGRTEDGEVWGGFLVPRRLPCVLFTIEEKESPLT